MKAYEFGLIVSGVDPHADDFEDRFFEAGCDDATLTVHRGAVIAAFTREADSFASAVTSACRDVETAGARIERLEPDVWVSQSEIAARANLTRSAISNYASGERGAGFPAPKARVTTASPLWDWAEVSRWLLHQGMVSEAVVQEAEWVKGFNAGVGSVRA
ncbi:MAG: helix-turn-helix domain-containing protein [Oceanicaulis sp.]|nr:helix-turn-helix domain-containing protein [Oceanicaulis sp.]